jgi:hypothetical protein
VSDERNGAAWCRSTGNGRQAAAAAAEGSKGSMQQHAAQHSTPVTLLVTYAQTCPIVYSNDFVSLKRLGKTELHDMQGQSAACHCPDYLPCPTLLQTLQR